MAWTLSLAPRVGYATLYVNGRAQGVYQVIERIDEHFLARNGLSRHAFLFKAENHNADFTLRDDVLLGYDDRSEMEGSEAMLRDLFEAVSQTPREHEAYARELETRLSFDDFELWNLVMSWAMNLDTFSKNYYLYRDPNATEPERGSVFRIIHWDADTSFGLWWTGARYEHPDQAPLFGERNRLSSRLYGIADYREPYLAHLEALLDGPLSAEAMKRRARAIWSGIEDDLREDFAHQRPALDFEAERAFLEDMLVLREQVMRDALREARAVPATRP